MIASGMAARSSSWPADCRTTTPTAANRAARLRPGMACWSAARDRFGMKRLQLGQQHRRHRKISSSTPKKTHRQPNTSVIHPATSGPAIPGTTQAPDRPVNTRGRKCSGNARPMTT